MRFFKSSIFLVLLVGMFSGCVTTSVTSPQFDQFAKQVKTIAVLPPDVSVNQINAGGQIEEMYEMSLETQNNIAKALEKTFSEKYDVVVKFINKESLTEEKLKLWREYKALYEVVGDSVIFHSALNNQTGFPSKKENFDYTLGKDLKSFADEFDADALLFVFGYDHYTTAGRKAATTFKVLAVAAASMGSVVIIPQAPPDNLIFGLVNAESGALEWFKIMPPAQNKNFRNEEHVNGLVEWFVGDMFPVE